MLFTTLLLLSLAGQQPTQQPAATPVKPVSNASQQADTAKAKASPRRHRARKGKSTSTAAPRDTTKSKP